MKDTLTIGLDNTAEYTVTSKMSAPHLPIAVLSTPTMVGLIEGVCLQATVAHLDEDETTVGTHVCVSHQGAVREGERFVIRCRLTSIENRRLNFDVEVDGPTGPVSRGTHQRAVVNPARMAGSAGSAG
ncbi:MAG TPA: hotdog domain-containing protein [Acidimicrobiales bacterium]|nr:hotdog domain-containing protein [Acidimicrobiales bacterium]